MSVRVRRIVARDTAGNPSLRSAKKLTGPFHFKMARPERFELPTTWFEARCSIQLSYGRVGCGF